MGKRKVRVVRVPKRVTVALLVVVSAGIASLLWYLSGKAYAGDVDSARELLALLLGSGLRSLSPGALWAFLLPVSGNILLFLPWGFLLFLALDADDRPRARSYAITFVAGLIFALALLIWQQFLPTRVTTITDAVSNGIGALSGAALGHMRKRVRVRFET